MFIENVKKAREFIIKHDIKCSKCGLSLAVKNDQCDRHKIEFEEQIKKQMFRNYCKANGLKQSSGYVLKSFMKLEMV